MLAEGWEQPPVARAKSAWALSPLCGPTPGLCPAEGLPWLPPLAASRPPVPTEQACQMPGQAPDPGEPRSPLPCPAAPHGRLAPQGYQGAHHSPGAETQAW